MFSSNHSFSRNLPSEGQLSVSKLHALSHTEARFYNDVMHRYIVDWGDGVKVEAHKLTLGPFQVTHSYQKANSYVVTAKYCSDPDGKPEDQCCDMISQKISLPANSSIADAN